MTSAGRTIWTIVALAGFSLVLASCSRQESTTPPLPSLPSDQITTTSAPTTTRAPALPELGGRILVLDPDGAIVTVLADGTDRQVVAGADPAMDRRSFPTWSPDGARIAWTEGGYDESWLVVTDAGGAPISRQESPLVAEYLAWSPDGNSIAMMGNDFWGEMTLVVADDGEPPEIVAQGAPMYIDWTPDGRALLTHIEDRFQVIEPDGSPVTTIAADGDFRVGAHVGEQIVFSMDGGDVGEILVLADQDGERRRSLVRYAAPAAVVSDDAGGRLALMSTWTPEGVEIADRLTTDLPVITPEQLVVVDVASGEVEGVASGRAVSWAWSPNGDRLLYSTLEVIDGVQKIRWHSWDGSTTTTFGDYTPTSRFGNSYLAFFDQYERSMSLWSPTSDAFVYAGGEIDGPSGIWVQPIDGSAPTLIGEGVFASWSP